MILNKNRFKTFQNENISTNQNNNNKLSTNLSRINTDDKINYNRNIGKNIVLFHKYVIGIKLNICTFISTLIGMFITFLSWIFSNNYFYSVYIYFFGSIFFVLTQIFFLLCFFSEPGIIPRNHPNYQEKRDETNKVKINIINKEIDKSNREFDKKINNDENIKNGISSVTNEKDENPIPKIYTERECKTCNIIRPPCCSHCRRCDNCVQDFDHHCFYVSNCIGKRNHKYFYLFLFFGSLASLYISFFDLFLIIYIFIINPKGIWQILYSNDKVILIISCVLISLSLICLFFGCFTSFILFVPSGIGFVLFFFIFYKNKPINFEKFRNPFVILVLILNLFLGIFTLANFINQTKNISKGITVKQEVSIKRETINNFSKNKTTIHLDKYFLTKLTKKEKIKNIIKFLFKKIDDTLIIPNRDL